MIKEQEKFDKDMQELLNDFKNTDWQDTNIFKIYKMHKRWVLDNDVAGLDFSTEDIYSESQIKYLQSYLLEIYDKRNQRDEIRKDEGAKFIADHKTKIFKTLQILMKHLNMDYFWLRIYFFFASREPILEEMQKLL